MGRTAKIALTADIRGFKKQLDDAKKALSAVGDAKISPAASKRLQELFSKTLEVQAKNINKMIMALTNSLERMGKAGGKAFDPQKATQYAAKLKLLQNQLKEINSAQEGGGGAAEGGGGFSLAGKGKLLAGAAAALGVRHAFNTRVEMARERMAMREVTTDAGTIGERSRFGFTPTERRSRGARLGRAAGSIGSKDLSNLTDTSEMLQRGFGVQEDTTSGAVESARKAGVQDQSKFLATAVGSATAAGLDGSKIGEFLESMSAHISEMSKGINVDSDSLTGFASAMGSLPFFKNDPSRIFAALGGLNSVFKGGDMFQKGQSTRGILGSAPGAGPAATEFRRSMGLFGQIDKQTMKKLKSAGVDTRAMEVQGGQIVQNIFDEIMKSTEKMGGADRLYEFQQRTGLEAGPAADMFAEMSSAKKEGRAPNMKVLSNALNPKSQSNGDSDILRLNSTMASIGEDIATNIAAPFTALGNKIDDLIQALGGDSVAVGGAVGTAGAVVGAGAAMGIGKGMAKGMGRLGTAVARGGMKGGAKAAGRMAGKMGGRLAGAIPIVGALVSAGFAMKDAYDIYEQYQSTGKVSGKAAAIFGADLVGLFSGGFLGIAGAAASAGLEGVPDDALGSFGGGGGGGSQAAASPMTPISGGSSGADPELNANTGALRDLTQAIKTSGPGLARKLPGNASVHSTGTASMGKK